MFLKQLEVEKDKDEKRKNKMSKYNLTELLNEYIGGGRIGTLNISYRDLVDKMDDLENSGKVIVREIPGPSGDGKTNREFEVVDRDSAVPGGKKQERGFTVYDYKFGFDPGSRDHFEEEYDFSVGGNNLELAMELIDGVKPYRFQEDLFKRDGGSEDNVDNIDKVASPSAKGKGYDSSVAAQSKESGDEMKQITQTTKPMFENMIDKLAKKLKISKEELMDRIAKMQGKEKDKAEADAFSRSAIAEEIDENRREKNPVGMGQLYVQPSVQKEIKRQLDAYDAGDIDVKDMIQGIEDIIFGHVKAPTMENGHVEDYADEIGENMYIDDDEFEMEMVMDRAKEIAPILKGIDMDVIVDFVKTHRQDIKGASDEEIKSEFEDFRSVNYDYIDEDLKKQFKRFM
tara:strand:- start:1737 stop:2936 length:1200 start_codon:yes stop_codon:yes gene_type:complete